MAVFVEYRVRQVARYVVTRHERDDQKEGPASSRLKTFGEFANKSDASEVCIALYLKEGGATIGNDEVEEPGDSFRVIHGGA